MSVNLLSRLWRPVLYVTIRHPQKNWYDLWLPLAAGVISAAIYVMLPKSISLVGDKGLLSHIQELVKILVGFYIAALAAVATFEKAGMDQIMEGKPPQIFEVQGETNHPGWHNLTRRRFLSFLFGYLALVSLILYCGTVVAFVLKPWVETLDLSGPDWLVSRGGPNLYFMWRGLTAFVFLLIFWNLVITTLVGLFYLADRLHRPEAVDGNKPESGASTAGGQAGGSQEAKPGEDDWH